MAVYKSDPALWRNVTASCGMYYIPSTNAPEELRHRSFGEIEGFPVYLMNTVLANGMPATMLVIRIASASDIPSVNQAIASDPQARMTKERLSQKEYAVFDAGAKYVYFNLWRIGTRNTSAQDAELLRMLVGIVARHARPLSLDRCENPDCRRTSNEPSRWALLNGFPAFYCPDCLATLPSLAAKARQNIDNAPTNLTRATLYGLAAALPFGIAIAIIYILFGVQILGILLLVASPLIMKVMGLAPGKPTPIRMIIALVLSLISMFVGSILVAFWNPALTPQLPLIKGTDIITGHQWEGFRRIFISGAFLILFANGFYLFLTWRNTRAALNTLIQPTVEIIPISAPSASQR